MKIADRVMIAVCDSYNIHEEEFVNFPYQTHVRKKSVSDKISDIVYRRCKDFVDNTFTEISEIIEYETEIDDCKFNRKYRIAVLKELQK